VVICLKRGADLHMAQLMPLPLTVSCFSKIQIGFTFLVQAHPGGPGQRAIKGVSVCVCVCVCACVHACVCVRNNSSSSGGGGVSPGMLRECEEVGVKSKEQVVLITQQRAADCRHRTACGDQVGRRSCSATAGTCVSHTTATTSSSSSSSSSC